MSATIATPAILTLLNDMISNIVGLIANYGVYLFAMLMFFFVIWLFYHIGVLVHDLITGI